MPISVPQTFLRLRRRRGVLLILTLWIVLVLILLAHSLAFEMQIETKLTSIYRDQFIAEQLARIGIARALADLRNDRLLEKADEEMGNAAVDSLGDIWTDGTIYPRPFEVETRDLGSKEKTMGQYELLVIDEESKIGLNRSAKSLDVLRYLLMLLDVDEDVAQEIANAIYDWTDPDDVPVNGTEQSERIYYTELARELSPGRSSGRSSRSSRSRRTSLQAESDEPSSFLPKNGRFNTVDELLQIPGITPELFYGYDPEEETDPEFFPKRSIQARGESPPGLRDLLTVRTNNLNVNTASYECLAAVFAAAFGDLDSGCEMAEAIIDYRQGNDDSNINDKTAFRNAKQLYEVEGFSSPFLGKVKNVATLTFTSNNFTIYCRANEGRKKGAVRSSLRRKEALRPLPTAHIIAECKRSLLNFPILIEDNEEEPIDPMLPAYRGRASARVPSPRRRPGSPLGGQAPVVSQEVWVVPVVYFKRWNSY